MQPPAHGRTWSIQHGGNILCLRLLPVIPRSWDALTDRWRAVSPQSFPPRQNLSETCQRLVFDSAITVGCVGLTEPDEWVLDRNARGCDFGIRYDAERLLGQRGIANIWGVTVDEAFDQPPTFETDRDAPVLPRDEHQQALILKWDWPGHSWRVRIDPIADRPLTEL